MEHIHDCTGADMTCPCGFRFEVAPICVSITVTDGPTVLVDDGFNCSSVNVAIAALEKAIRTLRGRA